MNSLDEMAVLLKPEDDMAAGVGPCIYLLWTIRRRLESQIQPKFDPFLSLILDDMLQLEESFTDEEYQR